MEQPAAPINAAAYAECLRGLGQEEETLESIPSADDDDEPWIHFIRSRASAKLGRIEEAAEHLHEYEALIDPDMLARSRVADILPDDGSDGDAE